MQPRTAMLSAHDGPGPLAIAMFSRGLRVLFGSVTTDKFWPCFSRAEKPRVSAALLDSSPRGPKCRMLLSFPSVCFGIIALGSNWLGLVRNSQSKSIECRWVRQLRVPEEAVVAALHRLITPRYAGNERAQA